MKKMATGEGTSVSLIVSVDMNVRANAIVSANATADGSVKVFLGPYDVPPSLSLSLSLSLKRNQIIARTLVWALTPNPDHSRYRRTDALEALSGPAKEMGATTATSGVQT